MQTDEERVTNEERVEDILAELRADFGQRQLARAQAMWGAILFGPGEKPDLNAAIEKNLDAESIHAFFHLVVSMSHVLGVSGPQSDRAMIRHTENHALRDAVYCWADKNIKPGISLDSAASEVAGKIVPLKWRTVRDHLTEWKKLRSTGTP